ncbi:MAG: hypothetical protein IKS07_02010 [Lachnospiraceae bacterium]|nr:hypothetical protein [Lachnospiraceae bacterium]
MRNEDFITYRKTYPSFVYRDFETDIREGTLHVIYHFEIPGLTEFRSRWEFPLPTKAAEEKARLGTQTGEDTVLKRLLFSLGMTETISYYKTVCPGSVEIRCGSLTPWQQAWWKKLYFHGLGEFLYVNGIETTQEDLVSFRNLAAGVPDPANAAPAPAIVPAGDLPERSPLHDPSSYAGYLVPVGGGKDSVVSLEVLKGEPITTYVINGNDTTRNVIDACSHKEGTYIARRILDKKILELNAQGYLNGHIPFSAVVAFSGVIAAYLTGKAQIALSNENSANESTVPGSKVNHQYSKSFEFERDFMEYFRSLTDSDIRYYSLLRPLTELQIAALFARYKAYHRVFRSCNRGSKEGIWCCNCPKCLFVNIILSPFLTEEALQEIFGEKLLDKESLDADFRALCGIEENKPFECVGTRAEVMACLTEYVRKGGRSLLTDRYEYQIRQMAESQRIGKNPDIRQILTAWCGEHQVPAPALERLREAMREK